MRHPLVVAFRVGLAALPGLAGACGTYATNRAALVPHATALPTDGQPMGSVAELALGATNLTDLMKPGLGNPDDAVEIPNTQLHGGLGLRINHVLSIGLLYEAGLSSGATPLKPTQPPVDGGNAAGAGGVINVSIPTSDPHWAVGVSTELMLWSVPWVAYSTCVGSDYCTPGDTTVEHGSDGVTTLALGVTPSYRSGGWTFFGGLTLRNHPMIVEKTVQTGIDTGGDVQSGPANVTASAGAEIELGAGVRASLTLQQTFTRDPVAYGPGLGVMLTIPLGRDRPDRIIMGPAALAPPPPPVAEPPTTDE